MQKQQRQQVLHVQGVLCLVNAPSFAGGGLKSTSHRLCSYLKLFVSLDPAGSSCCSAAVCCTWLLLQVLLDRSHDQPV